MSGTLIRSANASEQGSLEELQRRASLNNPGDREAMLAHPDAIELPIAQIEAGHVFVLEKDGAAVGFSVVLPREDGQAELDGLFVEPAFWRNGFGRLLVDHAAEVAAARGSAALHVVGNYHAEKFYMACGFRRIGLAKTRFGDALLMQRLL
ncbi:MAG TPA: GNAT family N-acetyltransferase [Opitutaceae bacterium]|jgi:GNAT superfamily N-acetyltransferase|nr:GNAT family N-acetyltransferase [Opitutaceae bacterium]